MFLCIVHVHVLYVVMPYAGNREGRKVEPTKFNDVLVLRHSPWDPFGNTLTGVFSVLIYI